MPHPGDLISSDVISQAAQLNQGLLQFPGYQAGNSSCPIGIVSDDISIEVIKKAEKNNCHIIRLVEQKGCFSTGIMKFEKYPVKIAGTDLMEWESNDIKELFKDVKIGLKPFEIRTYKVFL